MGIKTRFLAGCFFPHQMELQVVNSLCRMSMAGTDKCVAE